MMLNEIEIESIMLNHILGLENIFWQSYIENRILVTLQKIELSIEI